MHEIEWASKTILEFNGKSPTLLRNKLQHEFINWTLIEKSIQENEN